MFLTNAGLGGDVSALRRSNLRAVMGVLHAGGQYTISELARSAHLSRPTTAQAVEDLVAVGWVAAARRDPQASRLGRPAQAFRFRPEAGFVLGADVGAHKIVVMIADLAGTVVVQERRGVDPKWSAVRRFEALGEAIDAVIGSFPPGIAAIVDGAIATVGSVSPDGEVIFNVTMPDWLGQNPAAWLADRYGFRATAANDMNMSALAEHWLGAARDAKDVVYLHAGRRLGTGLLIGGRPHVGHHSVAVELGLWKGLEWKPSYDDLMSPFGSAAEVFDAAARGDEAAKARIEAFARNICQGLAPVVITIDPELVVIGGGISTAGEAIAEPVSRWLRKETAFAPRVVCSTLGDESVALGALRLALDNTEERLFAELAPWKESAE